MTGPGDRTRMTSPWSFHPGGRTSGPRRAAAEQKRPVVRAARRRVVIGDRGRGYGGGPVVSLWRLCAAWRSR